MPSELYSSFNKSVQNIQLSGMPSSDHSGKKSGTISVQARYPPSLEVSENQASYCQIC